MMNARVLVKLSLVFLPLPVILLIVGLARFTPQPYLDRYDPDTLRTPTTIRATSSGST